MSKSSKRFNSLDIEELAAHLCGFSTDDDYETDQVEEKMIEKYNIDLSYFTDLMNDISPLLDMAVSPLTEEPFIGFGDGNMWIAKIPYPKFINQVLIWLSAEKVREAKSGGFERLITSGGKPEFKIVLMMADQEYEMFNKKSQKVLIGHTPDKLPPIGSTEIDETFQRSESYPARVILLEQEMEGFDIVHYNHRRKEWTHSREGEKITVLEWYSRKEATNV